MQMHCNSTLTTFIGFVVFMLCLLWSQNAVYALLSLKLSGQSAVKCMHCEMDNKQRTTSEDKSPFTAEEPGLSPAPVKTAWVYRLF